MDRFELKSKTHCVFGLKPKKYSEIDKSTNGEYVKYEDVAKIFKHIPSCPDIWCGEYKTGEQCLECWSKYIEEKENE